MSETNAEWIAAGFAVEWVGSVKIYTKPVSEKIVRMCMLMSRKKAKTSTVQRGLKASEKPST